MSDPLCSAPHITTVAEILAAQPSGRRTTALLEALSFSPAVTLEQAFNIGPLRAALADFWELASGEPVVPTENSIRKDG